MGDRDAARGIGAAQGWRLGGHAVVALVVARGAWQVVAVIGFEQSYALGADVVELVRTERPGRMMVLGVAVGFHAAHLHRFLGEAARVVR